MNCACDSLDQWRIEMDPRTQRIQALNDELRQNLAGGVAVMTPGVAALGKEAVDRIVKTVAMFDDFCHANDPYEEHDFGSFEAEGHTIFFKIDYFDRNLKYLSSRSDRPGRHRSRDHGHARRRILRAQLDRSAPSPFSRVIGGQPS
jgi:Protein of unknown function (DUF3768)